MFKEISSKTSVKNLEEQVLATWEKNDIFKKSVELRKDSPMFVFYEGPPTANGNHSCGS